jgi:hypothetical protein
MYVKVVFSWFGWGQDLLVYYESYLKVHVKMYVTVVYSWFSWGLKLLRNSWVFHSNTLELELSDIRGQVYLVQIQNSSHIFVSLISLK